MLQMLQMLQEMRFNRMETRPDKHETDPRPDLIRDSPAWGRLLTLAWRGYPDLWGPLHGLRCLGARLSKGAKGWRISSDDPDYAEDRAKHLMPRRAELAELLAKIDPPNPA